MFLGALGVGILALVVDRVMLGPSEADAAAVPDDPAAGPVGSAPAVPSRAGEVPPDAGRPLAWGGGPTLAERLRQAAERFADVPHEVGARSAMDGAFAPPPTWQTTSATMQAVPVQSVSPAEAFVSRHRLTAVLSTGTSSGGGAVMLDGRVVRVGDQVDGWTLVAVHARGGEFVSGPHRASLALPDPATTPSR